MNGQNTKIKLRLLISRPHYVRWYSQPHKFPGVTSCRRFQYKITDRNLYVPTSWVSSARSTRENRILRQNSPRFQSNLAYFTSKIWLSAVCRMHVDHVSLLRIYLTVVLGLLDLRNRLTYIWSSSATLFQSLEDGSSWWRWQIKTWKSIVFHAIVRK